MERSQGDIDDEIVPDLETLSLITPVEPPITATEPYDPETFERGVPRAAAFDKIRIDNVDRDRATMRALHDQYRESMPWADDVLLHILANQHYDKALNMAKEIDADPEHPYHTRD